MTDPVALPMTLSPHGIAALALAAVVFAVFVRDRWPLTNVSLALLVAVPLGFALVPYTGADGVPIDPLRFLAGLAHPALVAICALMVIGQGLVSTGALEPAARRLANAVGQHPRAALLGVLAVAMGFSGMLNDTPVVVLLIPLLMAAARQAQVAASGMLLPMNFAVLIGGMATAIGTSTNLIVLAIAAKLGVGGFGLFGWADLVAGAALLALPYLWLVAPRLCRDVQASAQPVSEAVFDAELRIEPDSPLIDQPLLEALGRGGNRLQLADLRRDGTSLARLPSLRLQAGDLLVLRDTAARLKELEEHLGASLHTVAPPEDAAAAAEKGRDKARSEEHHQPVVAQMVLTPSSPLVGRTVRDEQLAERFQLIVVGLRPAAPHAMGRQPGAVAREQIANRTLAVGDVLLVQGQTQALQQAQDRGIGLLLDAQMVVPMRAKAPWALAVMAGVVALAATRVLPIALAALAGVLVLVASKTLRWSDVGQALSAKIILLVAASLALGDALQITGATAWLAAHMAEAAADLSPAVVVALLMGLMGLLTNFVSNNASAAIGTPLGISLAQALNAPAEPFVLAVLLGCNLCYLTPMGYQTNLLVMQAGGYRFVHFLRVGGPLFIIMWTALSGLLAWRYGLWTPA